MNNLLLTIAFIGTTVDCMAHATISKATINDIAHIAKIHHTAWQAEFSNLLSRAAVEKMNYAFCKSFWKRYFNKENAQTYIAKIDNHIAGFISIIKNNPSLSDLGADSEIDKIYIAPEYQGQGIGSKLVKYILEILQKKGYKKTIVKTFIKNKKAQQFYEKLGGICIQEKNYYDYHSLVKIKIYMFVLPK